MAEATRGQHEEEMTRRARAYLVVTAVWGLMMGGWCVLSPSSFTASSFIGLKEALPWLAGQQAMVVWGLAYVVLGVVCTHGAVARSEGIARSALLLACVLEGMWLGGYLWSWWRDSLSSPVGPIVWSVLLAKDAIALSNPMRNPFEKVANRVLADPN